MKKPITKQAFSAIAITALSLALAGPADAQALPTENNSAPPTVALAPVVQEVSNVDLNQINLRERIDTQEAQQAEEEKEEATEKSAPITQAAAEPQKAEAVTASSALGSATNPSGNIAIADASPVGRSNDFVPIDLTPVRLPERPGTFNNFENFKAGALYKLPGRVYLNASVENSLRFEVNTFQTNRHYLSDMVYRILPNVTLGYALTKKTRVAANYFFFRDQYDLRDTRLSRNIHSVGGQIQHDFNISPKTTVTAGLFPRALFISTANAPAVQFYDIIPSLAIQKRVKTASVIYGSVMGQIRFRDPFSNFQEGDQFYSFGGAGRFGKNLNWNYLLDTTLVTNFGNSNLRQGPNNQVIIVTGELGRRIHPRLPLTAFVRAEPIFNMGANKSPGYAGFNFRIFGGIRADIAKPAIFPVKLKS